MAEAEYKKHLPIIDGDSRGFWEGCREGELRLQLCGACGRFRYAPKRLCPTCLSEAFEWRAVSGQGEVYTFTIEH
ncbi:MAG: zinc ribbon domain-containing protein, partial [Nitrospinota bacterium]|nr:zinc ribbon domain-containing protein [Nitrospinota bacterium]